MERHSITVPEDGRQGRHHLGATSMILRRRDAKKRLTKLADDKRAKSMKEALARLTALETQVRLVEIRKKLNGT